MQKPHVILRTHSGVPTPPAWATRFRYHTRYTTSFTMQVSDVPLVHWHAKMLAVEWIA